MFRPGRGRFGAKTETKTAVAATDTTAAANGTAAATGSTTATAADGKTGEIIAGTGVPAWLARLQKDFADLDIPENVTMQTNRENPAQFSFVLKPNMGYWTGGIFEFKFDVPTKYPFEGPKVTCIDRIWHPNIDLDGGVCVSVLRPWKPTYSIQIILFGLLFLFSHPNPNDPLNEEAAKQMRDDPVAFGKQVVKALKGDLTVTQRLGTGETRTTTFTRNKGTGFTGLP
jgi:ubiquitin-conjugating enzyme E2 M